MLGDILKQKREQLGLTVQDIARMTGMPPKQVVALEANDRPYFSGGNSEVERLTKLYAKKINMPLDSAIWTPTSGGNKAIENRSVEVSIPAFLMTPAPAGVASPVNANSSPDYFKSE
jgi:transcriptional regulator with XRE-family HTH domain